MVKPSERFKKKTFKKLPGGKTVVRRKEARKGTPTCAICKENLKGTSYSPKLKKSERRPERPFGGYLCQECSEKVFVYKTRVMNEDMKVSDVPMLFQKYI
jgi:large subunit ribosomal protein L34e